MATRAGAVVVVHGLWMRGSETWLLRRRLARHGFAPFTFRYRSVRAGLDRNADALAAFIAGVPDTPVHLVGHSLGGVICVHLLKRAPPPRVGRLVCIGAPLNGSVTARKLLRLRATRRLLGRSVAELAACGSVGPWESAIELGTLAGRLGVGLGRLAGRLGGDSDGTVAVAETQIEGATDSIVRDVSHTTMLFSRVVADDIAHFLEHGRF